MCKFDRISPESRRAGSILLLFSGLIVGCCNRTEPQQAPPSPKKQPTTEREEKTPPLVPGEKGKPTSAPPTTLSEMNIEPPIDAFSYQFQAAVFSHQSSLALSRNGRVHYSFVSAPHTGSGGHTVFETWDIPKKEAKVILDSLIADGILDLPSGFGGKFPSHRITLTRGKWQASIRPDSLSDSIVRRLLPLLQEAHPEMWKENGEALKKLRTPE